MLRSPQVSDREHDVEPRTGRSSTHLHRTGPAIDTPSGVDTGWDLHLARLVVSGPRRMARTIPRRDEFRGPPSELEREPVLEPVEVAELT